MQFAYRMVVAPAPMFSTNFLPSRRIIGLEHRVDCFVHAERAERATAEKQNSLIAHTQKSRHNFRMLAVRALNEERSGIGQNRN